MNILTKTLLVLSVVFAGSVAQADQCAYVTKDYAQKAMNLLNSTLDSETKVTSWCGPCGETKEDAKNKQQETIKSVKIAHTGYQDFYEISINGKSVDMAYTYVAGINLAKYINANAGLSSETPGRACDLQGVSDEL